MIYDDLIDLHMLFVSSCWFKKRWVYRPKLFEGHEHGLIFFLNYGNEKSLLGGVLRGHFICTHKHSASFTVVSLDFSKCSLCHMYKYSR